jgi:putative flavoprotein involved in K+ transport
VPTKYRRPELLPEGGVLVVGASSSGIQLADELHRAGRAVTLAVGQHLRMPRHYRGRDILWWLDRMGLFGETVDQVYDVEISREQPSLQLVGHPEHITLDLAGLRERGVRVVGRLLDVNDGVVRFDDDLVATTAAADFKLASLLKRIDSFVARERLDVGPAKPFEPHCLRFLEAETTLRLEDVGIRTVLWATGFKRQYPWLHVPVLRESGEIRHSGGITPEPGFYALGLHFMRRRNSAFIDGVGDDARFLAAHLTSYLAGRPAAVA